MSTPSLFAIFAQQNLDTELSKNSGKTSCRKFKDISEKKVLIKLWFALFATKLYGIK